MEVKCPRCRYRFDMHKSPGVTMLQCFCPRCGQPFSYDIDTPPASGDGYPKSGTPTSDVGKSPSVIPPGHHGANRAREEATGDEDDVTTGRKEKKEPVRGHWQGAFMGESRGGYIPVGQQSCRQQRRSTDVCIVLRLGCSVVLPWPFSPCATAIRRNTIPLMMLVCRTKTRQQGDQNPIDDIHDDEQTADTVVAVLSAAGEAPPVGGGILACRYGVWRYRCDNQW